MHAAFLQRVSTSASCSAKKNRGTVDEVRLKLPFPNFYLSFHVNPFEEGASSKPATVGSKQGKQGLGEKGFDYIGKP